MAVRARDIVFTLLIWLVLAVIVEAGAYLFLRTALGRSPSDNPRVAEYMRRGHPLLADNEDLRARELGYRIDPYVGYRLLPDHFYPLFHSLIGTDALGFVHNGDPGRNPAVLTGSPASAYKILVPDGSEAFDGIAEQVYENLSHFNDRGNELFARWLAARMDAPLANDLAAKGWLVDKPGKMGQVPHPALPASRKD